MTGGHSFAETLTMTHCGDTARTPQDTQLVDIATILAAGILRLQQRNSLPESKLWKNSGDFTDQPLELSGQTVLSVIHGG
jgi:hypothetical protein